MKILIAKISHPKKKIFKISDLTYIKKNPYPDTLLKEDRDTWMRDGMNNPIEVVKHEISETPRKGANGVEYKEKQYSIYKGSSRINYALANGYDAIEGIIINE